MRNRWIHALATREAAILFHEWCAVAALAAFVAFMIFLPEIASLYLRR
jgi:hypothetical protein